MFVRRNRRVPAVKPSMVRICPKRPSIVAEVWLSAICCPSSRHSLGLATVAQLRHCSWCPVAITIITVASSSTPRTFISVEREREKGRLFEQTGAVEPSLVGMSILGHRLQPLRGYPERFGQLGHSCVVSIPLPHCSGEWSSIKHGGFSDNVVECMQCANEPSTYCEHASVEKRKKN